MRFCKDCAQCLPGPTLELSRCGASALEQPDPDYAVTGDEKYTHKFCATERKYGKCGPDGTLFSKPIGHVGQ
jgi:hypothetical protein